MDPLGAQPTITEAKDLPRWDADQSTLRSPIQIPADSTASPYSTSPFPVRRDLNQKIAFWQVVYHFLTNRKVILYALTSGYFIKKCAMWI